MSRSPHFFVERFNPKIEQYELQHPYIPYIWNYGETDLVPADLFPYNACHDLFSILDNENFSNDFPDMNGIHKGLPKDVCSYIKNSYDKYCDENWKPLVYHITYADMYIYLLKHPTVFDYDTMDEASYNLKEGEEIKPIYTDNPVKQLKDRIDAFMEVYDDWSWKNDYSYIRIVYWIN